MNNSCVVQGLAGQDAIDESSHNYLQLLGSCQNTGTYTGQEDQMMFDETQVLTTHSTNQSFNVLNFNNRRQASYD